MSKGKMKKRKEVQNVKIFFSFLSFSIFFNFFFYKGTSGCIEFDKLMYEGPRATHDAVSQVSDHRPVWALFSTENDDDAQVNIKLAGIKI